MTTDSLLTHWAGEYLSRGLRVIALSGKMPNGAVHPHWRDDYLAGAPECDADWDVVRRVFEHPATTGVGIVIPPQFVVVDIDGEEGAEQWRDLMEGDLDLDHARWVAKTGRGLHIWYGTFQPTGTIKLGSKLDLKGEGGYVAAPPSLHPDGHTYQWLVPPGAEAPFEAPEPLARRIAQHVRDSARAIAGKKHRTVIRKPRYQEGDTVFYAQLGYDGVLTALKAAQEGNRNNMLHWAAATIAEEGGIDEDFEELADVALKLGLEPIEVKRTIRSARRG